VANPLLSFSLSATPTSQTVLAGGTAASYSITLTPGSGFTGTVSISPSGETIARGKSGTYTVTVKASLGFSGTAPLSESGLPSKITASFNRTSVTNSGSSTLTVQVGRRAQPGTTTTIIGTGGGLARSTTTIFDDSVVRWMWRPVRAERALSIQWILVLRC
jgi:hypothetical protein